MITISDVKNNDKLFDEFIHENMRLVTTVIKKRFRYVNNTLDYDDYFQTGCIGLVKAAKRYDPKYGTAFSTYAIPLIEGEIMRYRRDYCITNIHTPRTIKDKYFKYQALKNTDLGDAEICRALDVGSYELAQIINAVEGSCSLDTPLYENNSGLPVTGIEVLAGSSNMENESLDRLEMGEKLSIAKKVLSVSDYMILMLHLKNNTQESIGKKLGISQAQVSRRLIRIREICKSISNGYNLGFSTDEYLAG